MKKHYIQQVAKSLRLSHTAKMEVLRDLDEVFASAMEHGETEQQVIERLGTPKEFVKSIHEQLGIPCAENRGQKIQIGIIVSFLISFIAFAAAFFIYASKPAKNIIGQADAATAMQVVGNGIDLFSLMVLLGFLALIIAVFFIVRLHHKKD